MSESFTLVVAPHRVFGALATFGLGGQPLRRFTRQEALIVSRALDAVARGASAESQIYMSPIASDQDFDAQVREEGVFVTVTGEFGVALDWEGTRALASALGAFGASAAA